MNGLIEGLGNEVTLAIVALLFTVIAYLAWVSTGFTPSECYVWLFQMQLFPHHRVVQVLHMDHEDAAILEQHLARPQNAADILSNVDRRQTSDGNTENADSNAHGQEGHDNNATNLDSSIFRLYRTGATSAARHWIIDASIPPAGTSSSTQNISPPNQFHEMLRRRIRTGGEEDVTNETGQETQRLLVSRLTLQLQEEESLTSVSPSREEENNFSASVSEGNDNSPRDSPESVEHAVTHQTSPSVDAPNLQDNQHSEQIEVFPNVKLEPNGNEESIPSDSSVVKVKFLDDTQLSAPTALEATVGQFKRRYFNKSIDAGKVVRLIFQGQLLRDDSRSLSSYGLHDQCVLHCHISSTPYAHATISNSNGNLQHSQQGELRQNRLIPTTAAAALAAIAGSRSVSVSTAGQLAHRYSAHQFYRGQNIDDRQADPYLIRARNACLRGLRRLHNLILGPGPTLNEGVATDPVEDAADAASRPWNYQEQANNDGFHIGQYLHLIFTAKFIILWMFVLLFPQYTDRFSLLLLTVLSFTFAAVFLNNRQPNTAVRL
ncbi:hypothetical protein AB6A40_001383 [Gnathostoma spinigerum]|uniref:Ubiquitin-like domain-containing protein n=1 Tax=Gnathostoma spinigerum TaxID=75299 RepID=A0ABD6EBE8_9BILA